MIIIKEGKIMNKFLLQVLSLMFGIGVFSNVIADTQVEPSLAYLKNVTNCHVVPEGGHYLSRWSLPVGTYESGGGNQYSVIDPGEWGYAPVFKGEGGLYVVLDHDIAADRWRVSYSDKDKYILSYDGSIGQCVFDNSLYACFILSETDVCK
jgi:hypothetical protein